MWLCWFACGLFPGEREGQLLGIIKIVLTTHRCKRDSPIACMLFVAHAAASSSSTAAAASLSILILMLIFVVQFNILGEQLLPLPLVGLLIVRLQQVLKPTNKKAREEKRKDIKNKKLMNWLQLVPLTETWAVTHVKSVTGPPHHVPCWRYFRTRPALPRQTIQRGRRWRRRRKREMLQEHR